MARRQAKTKDNFSTLPPGEWQALNTVGDVKRFLRHIILGTEAGRMDVKVAGCLGQLTSYLLKCMEIGDLAVRVAALEKARKGKASLSLPTSTSGNGHDVEAEI